jgi:hypothetical protein
MPAWAVRIEAGLADAPQEVGHFIPAPAAGKAAPQTNDVDERGLVYIVDRYTGFDILEFKRP